MRAGLCRDVPLEIYHLLLIDKDIYQQPKERPDGKDPRCGRPLYLRFYFQGRRQSPIDPPSHFLDLIVYNPLKKTHHESKDEDFMFHLSTEVHY